MIANEVAIVSIAVGRRGRGLKYAVTKHSVTMSTAIQTK